MGTDRGRPRVVGWVLIVASCAGGTVAVAQDAPARPPAPSTQPAGSRPGPRTFVNQPGRKTPPGPNTANPGATNPPTGKPATVPATHTPVEPPAPAEGHQPGPEDEITLSAFSEPVELSALVDYVAKALNINMTVTGTLAGSVVFNAPVAIKRGQLLKLLDALLEQQGYTVSLDPEGFYVVHPVSSVPFQLGTELPTTKIIPTPNIRPTALKTAIESQMSSSSSPGAQPGQIPGQGGIAASKGLAYIDELGVIVVTDTPRRIAALDSLVERLIGEYNRAEYTRLELRYIAAPVAKSRALELVGQTTGAGQGGVFNPNTGQVEPQGGVPGIGGSSNKGLDNLGERLAVDPLSNALIFRGIPGEVDQVRKLLDIIDAPSSLKPKMYSVGSAAKQVADIARDRGLGQVTLIAAPQFNPNNPYGINYNFGADGNPQQQQKQNLSTGGPVMVVDEERGTIVYYGTDEQQALLTQLITSLNVEDERITIETYKLRHSDATKVAEIVLGLIQNTTPAGTSDLLPDGGNTGANVNRFNSFNGVNNTTTGRRSRGARNQGNAGQDGELSLSEDERIFVLADKGNNQILVKAPAKDQSDFAKLISRLDQRRAQVYIEAKIVALTADDRLRLAFEQQLINANGTGGVLNTNFGLSSFATGNTLLNPKTVGTGLSGLTAAIIKSDQVPIIMTALARETESKIISTPQLLVDDNEESSVVSVDEQPTTSISRGSNGSNDVVTSGEPAKAGTTLKVTPQISAGGYLRLKYEIELSSFTGEAQTVGNTVLPPPKQTNNVKSDNVTVPSDSTVVVGGLVVRADTKTVAKIPLLGDIPLLGLLFQDRNTGDRQTTLYIFLTPKIIRDPNFEDLKLLTRGPMKTAGLNDDMPLLKPTLIEIIEPMDDPKAEPKGELRPAEMPVEPDGVGAEEKSAPK